MRTLLLLAVLPLHLLAAQSEAGGALASWTSLDAPVGHEARTLRPLVPLLNRATGGRWTEGALGSLVLRKGSGAPRRVVACGIDRPGFVVTQIRSDGLLRLHTLGTSAHPLWEQAHEGQQLEILTARGAVPAVSAIANGHFAAQHARDTLVVSADDLWVDVGAASAAEVATLGIVLLDPVQRRLPAWPYAGHVSGASAGRRAGCAAVVAAARGTPSQGETIFVISTQASFGWPGLGGTLARASDFTADSITVFGNGAAQRGTQLLRAGGGSPINAAVFRAARRETIVWIAPAVRHPGALVESVAEHEAAWLLREARRAAGITSGAPAADSAAWVAIPVRERASARTAPARAGDAHASTMRTLAGLADLPAVPGDEWRVREAIRAQLPAWARERATVDDAGNLVVSVGPARDTVVFMAHMDEVAYDVSGIAGNGTVTLRARGGAVASAWEGQPAILHLPRTASGTPDTLPGIFVTRDSARTRRPRTMTAWFGLDSAALVARGVRIGAGITSPKVSVRLAGTRFTGRSMDDRAGSTALLHAVQALDPATLDHAVMLVWSTREEGGLLGAQAVAERVASTARRIYSIDTFVSSDTPLESPHFANVALGGGPVLRAIENGSISPLEVRAKVQAAARGAGIPLQIGLTQGGTDGTTFTFYGAPNTGLSWPGRYSHTPAEVSDLRDIERLSRLLLAVIRQAP
jgi:putative aminopeptidase FrvX